MATVETLVGALPVVAPQLTTEVLKNAYRSVDLSEGIDSSNEILLFHIPYFYAVKQSLYPTYSELHTLLT